MILDIWKSDLIKHPGIVAEYELFCDTIDLEFDDGFLFTPDRRNQRASRFNNLKLDWLRSTGGVARHVDDIEYTALLIFRTSPRFIVIDDDRKKDTRPQVKGSLIAFESDQPHELKFLRKASKRQPVWIAASVAWFKGEIPFGRPHIEGLFLSRIKSI